MRTRTLGAAALCAALALGTSVGPAKAIAGYEGALDPLVVSGWTPWSDGMRFSFWVDDSPGNQCVYATTFAVTLMYRKSGTTTWRAGNSATGISPESICSYEYVLSIPAAKFSYKKSYDVKISVTEMSSEYEHTTTVTGIRRGTPWASEGEIWPSSTSGNWYVAPSYSGGVHKGKARITNSQLKYRLGGGAWQTSSVKKYSWSKRSIKVPGATTALYPDNPFSKVSDCQYRLKNSYGWGPWVWCGSDTSEDYLGEYY